MKCYISLRKIFHRTAAIFHLVIRFSVTISTDYIAIIDGKGDSARKRGIILLYPPRAKLEYRVSYCRAKKEAFEKEKKKMDLLVLMWVLVTLQWIGRMEKINIYCDN